MKKLQLLYLLLVFMLYACNKSNEEDLLQSINFEMQQPANINTELLQEMEYFISSGKYGIIHSILVIKDNQCVFEKYYNGSGPESLNPLYTATPFVVSALAGIAFDKGCIENQDVRIVDYFKDEKLLTDSITKQKIRLHHVLSQCSGIKSGMNWRDNEDAYSIILNSEIGSAPGELYTKDAGAAFLLGSIMQQAVGQRLDSFALQYLFKPLEIENWHWENDAYGNLYTDGAIEGLSLTSRDFAKIGLLYLNNGKWNGNQIVSNYWVNETMKPWMYMSYDFHQGYFCNIMNRSTTTPRLYETSVVNVNGLSQNMWLLNEINTLIVVTADKNASKDKLPEFLTHYMLPALFPDNKLEHNLDYTYYADVLDSIKVDGNLNEWSDFGKLIPKNPARIRNTFTLSDYKPEIMIGWSRYRPTKIYIAAEISDDVIIENQPVNDHIEVSLDLLNTGRTYKWVFNANGTFYGDVATSANTLFEVQKLDNTYSFEIEIDLWKDNPVEYDLKKFFIEPGTTIGLKVNCTDVDDFADIGTVIGWSTDDEADFLFNDYTRPALFGSVIFIGN